MATMAQTLSFSPLSLDLPNSRMSVDFSTFTTSQPRSYKSAPHSNKPHPLLPQHNTVPRRAVPRPLPLPDLMEEPEAPRNPLTRQTSRKWPWSRLSPTRLEHRDASGAPLSRTNSSASNASSASTAVSSVFSAAQSVSTNRTAHSSLQYANTVDDCFEERLNLSSLPPSLLEHILSYALCLPLTVSIGPQNSENRHMQYRYHRAGLDYIDIQLILKHPVFMVSHHIRDVALDVFHRKCDFVIDLHRIYHTKVSSTINENLKKHQKFWMTEPPKMVRTTLSSLSKLHLRLPVASCENGGHRGRDEDNWMDGSDGQGGGSWRIKSMKREQEDAVGVQKCLEAIMKLVMTDPGEDTEPRGRTSGLARTSSLRRVSSLSRARSKSRDRQAQSQRQPAPRSENKDKKREPLKRLEIVLVKRNSYVMVLPETLGLIKLLRTSPVTGFTRYHFELEAQKVLWAAKYRKRWQGFEPDGARLLNDLQGLTVAEKPIEPIRTPTEFKFVNVNKGGKLQLSETALPKTPIVLERPPTADQDLPALPPLPSNTSILRKPLQWSRKLGHKRKDSFQYVIEGGMDELGSSGTTTSGRVNPPTVDELRKIAEDIKNGLY